MADETSSRDVNFVPVITGVTNNTAKDIVQIRVDETTNRLLTDTNATDVGHTAVGSGSLYIKASGEIVQLSDIDCKRVFIQNTEGSDGVILVGGSNVAATLELRKGLALYPTQGAWFNISNLNLLYISSLGSGNSVTYFYEN